MLMTNPAGTYGYVDPLYVRVGILTKESDIYSFGVVLFEVLCERPAFVKDYSDLDRLARTSYENGELDKIIDTRIKKHIKPRVLRMVSDLAYKCLQETRGKRPTIEEVTLQLKEANKIQVEARGGPASEHTVSRDTVLFVLRRVKFPDFHPTKGKISDVTPYYLEG